MADAGRFKLQVKVKVNENDYEMRDVRIDADTLDNKHIDDIITFENFYEFPSTGKSCCLYVDTYNQKIYYWDAENLIFRTVGSNWEDIDLIDCGGA